MKILQYFIALAFIILIIVMFVKQSVRKNKLFSESLYGKVISVGRGSKGYYDMNIVENNKWRQISFIPENDTLTVSAGDSVYKESNSDVFYIKKNEMSAVIKARWKDIHINGKWEK